MAEYVHIAILRSCIEALPANDMDETMLISLDAAQDRIEELEKEILQRDLRNELESLESVEPGFLEPDQILHLNIRIAELRGALNP